MNKYQKKRVPGVPERRQIWDAEYGERTLSEVIQEGWEEQSELTASWQVT